MNFKDFIKTVDDALTGMQSQYRVSRGINSDFTLVDGVQEVNFNCLLGKIIYYIKRIQCKRAYLHYKVNDIMEFENKIFMANKV